MSIEKKFERAISLKKVREQMDGPCKIIFDVAHLRFDVVPVKDFRPSSMSKWKLVVG